MRKLTCIWTVWVRCSWSYTKTVKNECQVSLALKTDRQVKVGPVDGAAGAVYVHLN